MPDPAISDELAALLDLDPADRRDAESLLVGSGGRPEVAEALAVLRSRLGQFPGSPPSIRLDEDVWICAILRFAPTAANWFADRPIDRAVTCVTFADVGRHFRLHRRTHSSFGLETWAFLTQHLAGELFAIGRLQFALRRLVPEEPLPPVDTAWVLDVHIPSDGPLVPEAVDASFAEAVTFFARHFPDQPARIAVCFSWLLDPYLAENLEQGSNIARFQQLFRRYGDSRPGQDDVLYFVFRTRDGAAIHLLPRDTTLQRLVVDRIAGGGTWQCCHGFRVLDQYPR